MKTNLEQRAEAESFCQKSIRSKDPGPYSARELEPGCQVYFRIPHKGGDLNRAIWGRVLSTKSRKAGEVMVVVDDIGIINTTAKIANSDVISVSHCEVISLIPRASTQVLVEVCFEDGVLASMRRVDGKTQPLEILVREDEHSRLFKVDHKGFSED